ERGLGGPGAGDRHRRLEAARRQPPRDPQQRVLGAAELGRLGDREHAGHARAMIAGRLAAGARAPQRGGYMITATPTRQMPAPIRSQRSGRKPSKTTPHNSEPATNTPP